MSNKESVRQILLWQQIGCVVVALANKLSVSYKRALDIIQAILADGFTTSKADCIYSAIYIWLTK